MHGFLSALTYISPCSCLHWLPSAFRLSSCGCSIEIALRLEVCEQKCKCNSSSRFRRHPLLTGWNTLSGLAGAFNNTHLLLPAWKNRCRRPTLKRKKKRGKPECVCKECTWIQESNTNGKDGAKEGGYLLEFSKLLTSKIHYNYLGCKTKPCNEEQFTINNLLLPLFARIFKYEPICQLVPAICFHKCISVWYGREPFP